LTEAHTDEEVNIIVNKFSESMNEMMEAGFFDSAKPTFENKAEAKNKAKEDSPVEGARLGRDKNGNPAWFITDPDRPGKYVQVK